MGGRISFEQYEELYNEFNKIDMYKVPEFVKSSIKSVPVLEGETIERKIERIVTNKEPITDGAPEIFTERKDGIIAAYNIRTDRWELAADAMDAVARSVEAKRDSKPKMEVVKEDKVEVSEAKPAQGESGAV